MSKIIDKERFEVRDLRNKGKFVVDDKFLNGYARFVEIYAVGVYSSLCRHANKQQKCWPSVKKMAEELGCGKDSVIQALKRLRFWEIIKSKRVGKQCTNRYYLLDKEGWKLIDEVSIKEYSEVYHIDFKTLSHRLQVSVTPTSNSKETQEQGNTIGRGTFSSGNIEKNSNSPYEKKSYYEDGREMRQTKKDGKWWVIPKGGGHPWSEYAGKESEIVWK